MKFRSILVLAAFMTVGTSLTYATACANSVPITSNEPSCTLTYTDYTLTFSNFVDTGDTNIFENVDFVNTPFVNLGGFTFTDGSGSFVTAGTLGYTVTLSGCAVGFTCSITGYNDQVFITSGSASISVSFTPAPTNGSPQTLNLGTQTDNQPNSVNTQTATKLATYNGSPTLVSYESDVEATAVSNSSVPEPATLSLLGAGLLGLGLLGRRQAAKK